MEIEQTKAIIEAILFAAGRPVTENELMLNLELSKDDIKQIIESMKEDLMANGIHKRRIIHDAFNGY